MLPWDEAIYEQMPFAFFKELGIGALNRALGGVLAGIYLPQFIPPQSRWESNQGAFLAAFDVRAFMPLEEFQAQMDAFVAAARNMQPFPGTDQAELPGNLEWQRERDYIRDGLPIEPGHQQALADLSAELGVESPFAQYEHQRFGALGIHLQQPDRVRCVRAERGKQRGVKEKVVEPHRRHRLLSAARAATLSLRLGPLACAAHRVRRKDARRILRPK